MRLSLVLVMVLLVVAVGGPAESAPPPPTFGGAGAPGRTFIADAPPGFDYRLLGVPLDANFRAAQGVGSLFPQAGLPAPFIVNGFDIEQKLVSTAEELSANAQAWALDLNIVSQQRQRFAFFRAVQWTTAWELQTNGPMLKPPPWAVYYASKVFLGRSYTEVVQGDSATFNARAGAHFLTAPVGMNIGSFSSQHNLTTHRAGAGFVPTGPGSMFARTEQDVMRSYRPDGVPVIVAVEYTQLPGTAANGAIIFPPPRMVTVRFDTLDVGAPGAMFTGASNWTIAADCMISGLSDMGTPQSINLRVSRGRFSLPFVWTVKAGDDEQIMCTARGTYARGLPGETRPLAVSTTGPILVGRINNAVSGPMSASDADTSYAITWSMTKSP
jgi:hypothetical protein